ncbi:MAG: ABC transporter substrate-binding protein, partial [Plesiomonas shigelloides]
GTIGNVHYLAIPFNASAKAAAQVVANFLLSPAAQRHKADLAVWGDPSVLTSNALASATSDATAKSVAVESQTTAKSAAVPVLSEPHVSWVEPLEKAWLQRYGAQ